MSEDLAASKDDGKPQGKIWSDGERLELAEKLDQELDDFIDGLEKKRYEDGWPEDRWQEEFAKHPFFMTKEPQPGDEVHPMFEGLQKLKYDPEENTKEELALNYKEDGNFYMKHKKFRTAILSFTEAIKVNCENPDIIATLYNNRSAAQFFLKNYRSSLSDAQLALKYKPDYTKAHIRAAQCAFELEKFSLCTKLCNEILEDQPVNAKVKELLKKNKEKKMEAERNERREEIEAKRRLVRFKRLRYVLIDRQIKFDDLPEGKSITEELLKPKFLPIEDFPVHLDEDGVTLVWPAAFSYPEYMCSDFQQQLTEDSVIEDVINFMFTEQELCDRSCEPTCAYEPSNLAVYYENRKAGTVHRVDLTKTIEEIIDEKDFYVTGGSLLFYVVPKDTTIEEEFLKQPRRPLIYS